MHRLLTWLLICFVLCGTGYGQTLQKGVVDLQDWDPETTPLLKLTGEAEFYWQQWILTDGISAAPLLMTIPSGWNFDHPFPAHGYASYRVRMRLDRPRELRLMMRGIYTSARIFVDGRLITTIGQPGKTAESTIGDVQGIWEYSFTPRTADFDLVVEVANFDVYLGGMLTPIYLGTQDGVRSYLQGLTAYSYFLVGTVFVMSFYHFGLFFLRRSDLSTFYYGLLCFCVGIYSMTADPADTWNAIFPMSFSLRVYLYNLSWILCVPVFLLYTKSLFPTEISSRLVKGIALFSVLYVILIAFLDTRSYMDSTQAYQYVLVLVIFYTVLVVARAWRQKREGIGVFFYSLLIIFAMAIHDLIMVRGYYMHVPLAGLGMFIFTFCQSYLISARFSHALGRAEKSEAEVRKLASTLEIRVAEQTQEIRSIMQSIELGIFAIHGPDQLIHKDYSQHLETLLESGNLENQKALPLLFEQSNITADQQSQIQSVIMASLGDSVLNFEINRNIFPRHMIRYSRDGDLRNFELAWNPILRDANTMDKLLVSINDVTDLRKWQKEAQHSAEELNRVAEIINIRESEFQRFIRSSRELLQQNLTLLQPTASTLPREEMTKILLMNLHTIKGSARILGFRGISTRMHQLEQAVSQGQLPHDLIDEHNDLVRQLDEYQRLAIQKLGRTADHQIRITLSAAQAASAWDLLQSNLQHMPENQRTPLEPLLLALQNQLFTPLPHLMREILRSADALARDLSKPRPHINFKVPPLMVDSRLDEMLRLIFFHLIRNAMDHGLEPAEQRLSKGKSETGTLLLHIEEDGKDLAFRLQDDGRGLQLNRIRELARAQGLVSEDSILDPQSMADQMFTLGISTAPHITQVSGRGLGMAAVARFIQEAGGKIRMQLLENQPVDGGYPFALLIRLPLALFHRVESGTIQAA